MHVARVASEISSFISIAEIQNVLAFDLRDTSALRSEVDVNIETEMKHLLLESVYDHYLTIRLWNKSEHDFRIHIRRL